jgi:hypothetical protein
MGNPQHNRSLMGALKLGAIDPSRHRYGDADLPAEFSLSQNYPNRLTPTTSNCPAKEQPGYSDCVQHALPAGRGSAIRFLEPVQPLHFEAGISDGLYLPHSAGDFHLLKDDYYEIVSF